MIEEIMEMENNFEETVSVPNEELAENIKDMFYTQELTNPALFCLAERVGESPEAFESYINEMVMEEERAQ